MFIIVRVLIDAYFKDTRWTPSYGLPVDGPFYKEAARAAARLLVKLDDVTAVMARWMASSKGKFPVINSTLDLS